MKNMLILSLFVLLLFGCSTLPDSFPENAVVDMEINSGLNVTADIFVPPPDLTLFYEATAQIHENMPPFLFRAYCQDKEPEFVSELYIINAETNEPISDFCLIDYMVGWDVPLGVPAKYFTIDFIDVNFDGYKDINILAGPNGNWDQHHIYFVWDSDSGRFIDDPYGLIDLGLPTFDEENQLVHSMRRASAADHWFYTHRYVDGDLITIEEVSLNLVWNSYLDELTNEKIKAIEPLYDPPATVFQHFMIEQLDFDILEMVIVENKFILYGVNHMGERDSLAEYGFDSELGLLLRELLGGVEFSADQLKTKRK